MILSLLVFFSFFSLIIYFNTGFKNTYSSFLTDINIFEKDTKKMEKSDKVWKGGPLIVQEGSSDKETRKMYPSGFDRFIYIAGDIPKASLLLGFSEHLHYY